MEVVFESMRGEMREPWGLSNMWVGFHAHKLTVFVKSSQMACDAYYLRGKLGKQQEKGHWLRVVALYMPRICREYT